MNNSESDNLFKPKQALDPTPQLYDDLVGDGMEKLAKATVAELMPIDAGSVILDLGCGTGAGTAAFVDAAGKDISVVGIDINDDVLDMYKKKVGEKGWPAKAVKGDANKLDGIADSSFTHAIATAMVFVLPHDAVPAIREIYRTVKPGHFAALSSWAYVPNMGAIRAASRETRPAGTPELRGGMDQWEDAEFLKSKIEEGGFTNVRVVQRDVNVTTTNSLDRFATMLWSFIGGTTSVGWLESDENNWDEAIEIIKTELSKTDGYKELDGGKLKLKFVANVAVATK